MLRSIPYLADQRAVQQAENTLSCNVDTPHGIVRVSFFGALPLRRVLDPDIAEDNGLAIASQSTGLATIR